MCRVLSVQQPVEQHERLLELLSEGLCADGRRVLQSVQRWRRVRVFCGDGGRADSRRDHRVDPVVKLDRLAFTHKHFSKLHVQAATKNCTPPLNWMKSAIKDVLLFNYCTISVVATFAFIFSCCESTEIAQSLNKNIYVMYIQKGCNFLSLTV